MLLLRVSVECRITEVGFVTVLALVVSSINIVLAATTATRFFKAFVLVSFTKLAIVPIIILLIVKHAARHLNWLALGKLLKIGNFIRSLKLRRHLPNNWVRLHHHLRLHLVLQRYVGLVILLLHVVRRILRGVHRQVNKSIIIVLAR